MKVKSFPILIFLFSLNLTGSSQSLIIGIGGADLRFPEDFRIQGPTMGKPFPIDTFQTLSGEKIDRDFFIGKTVVLNVWYVGCKGCKQEEPYLKRLTSKFEENEEVYFLGISMSKEVKVRKHFEKNGNFGYETALMERKEVEEKYGVYTSPTHFIVKDGILVEKFTMPIAFEELLIWFETRIGVLVSE